MDGELTTARQHRTAAELYRVAAKDALAATNVDSLLNLQEFRLRTAELSQQQAFLHLAIADRMEL